MKNATTKRHLQTLIRFMEKLPRSANKHFNMAWWFSHDRSHEHKIGAFITAKALTHCGTKACALGWAATIPSLRRAGLKVEATQASERPVARARRVFGLNDDQFRALFTTSSFFGGEEGPMDGATTPQKWAKQARKLLREWSAS